jgi:predicted glycoside hydrolase/deacetylase ChbG (UPF0249 family)
MAPEVNKASFSAIENGYITAASIMVPAPNFEDAARYARKHPDFSWGLHLTLTSEWNNYRWGPVLGKDKVPTLVDREGFFYQRTDLVDNKADLNEIEQELRAQIDLAILNGISPSHLDTHMYALFDKPELLDIYIKLGIEYHIPILLFPDTDKEFVGNNEELNIAWTRALARLTEAGLPVINFYDGKNYFTPTSQRKKYIFSLIENLPVGVSLIALHLAEDSEWFSTVTKSSKNRAVDASIAKDTEVLEKLRKCNVKLISWKDLLKMSRAVSNKND